MTPTMTITITIHFSVQVEKARHSLLLRDKIQQELYNTREGNMPKSETDTSLNSTISNDSMDKDHELLDRCVRLLMRSQPPVLSPPPFKVSLKLRMKVNFSITTVDREKCLALKRDVVVSRFQTVYCAYLQEIEEKDRQSTYCGKLGLWLLQ